MNTYLIAVISVAFSVAAQFLLKAGMSSADIQQLLPQPFSLRLLQVISTNMFVIGGFILYGIGALAWLGVLSHWEVSKAYPFVGLGFLVTVAVGALLGEQVTLLRVAGVAMISTGVWLISNS